MEPVLLILRSDSARGQRWYMVFEAVSPSPTGMMAWIAILMLCLGVRSRSKTFWLWLWNLWR